MELLEEQLDEENEKLLHQYENMLGLGKNKEVLRDIIRYHQIMKQGNHLIGFVNYNIVIRNKSNYYLYEDLIAVIAKVYAKNGIIQDESVYYLSRRRVS